MVREPMRAELDEGVGGNNKRTTTRGKWLDLEKFAYLWRGFETLQFCKVVVRYL